MATPSTPPPVGSVDHLAADRRVGRRCRTRLDPRRGWRLLLEALGVHDAPHPKTRQPCSRRVLGPARRCKQAFQKATSIPLASHGAGGEQADGHALGGRVALRQSRRHGCITRTVVIKHRRSLALRLTRSRRTSRMRGWTSLTLTRRANTWPSSTITRRSMVSRPPRPTCNDTSRSRRPRSTTWSSPWRSAGSSRAPLARAGRSSSGWDATSCRIWTERSSSPHSATRVLWRRMPRWRTPISKRSRRSQRVLRECRKNQTVSDSGSGQYLLLRQGNCQTP